MEVNIFPSECADVRFLRLLRLCVFAPSVFGGGGERRTKFILK
jgi:hypothetical protein